MVWSRGGAKPPSYRVIIAYEQPLRSTLAAGQEKEGELATTSLEFEYLHRKSGNGFMITVTNIETLSDH